MVVLVVCLVASMVIAIVRLATTPNEILGDGFHGLPAPVAPVRPRTPVSPADRPDRR